MKIKKGDKVLVTAGRDKGAQGKVLAVNRKTDRVVVEGVNLVSKHTKPRGNEQKGGIVKKEAMISVSNVMYLHKGKPTRIGYKVEQQEVGGKMKNVKKRVARSTGEIID